jgi:hypothetical protein
MPLPLLDSIFVGKLTVSPKRKWNRPGEGSCEKIDLVLFGVIPAKAGIQVFHGLTN